MFAASERIRQAAGNSPWMALGERGPAVAILQGAIIDLGYKMPVSTAKTGAPDGIYVTETKRIVYQFQVDKSLKNKDGIAGRQTFAKLDALLASKKGPPKSKPTVPKPPVAPPPEDRHYQISIGDPAIKVISGKDTYAYISRPRGSGTGRLSPLAVSIHSSITFCALTTACS